MIQKNTEWNPSFFVRSFMILRVGTVAYLSFAQITTLCVLNVFNVWILFGWMSFSRVMTGDMFQFFLFCCKNGFQFYPIFTNTAFWTLVFLCSCILLFSPQAPPVLDVQVEEAYDALRRWSPDFMIAAGFPVLPPHAVTIPTRAALNFHPSAFVRRAWRGGSVIFPWKIT